MSANNQERNNYRLNVLKRFIRTIVCIIAFELVRIMAYLTIFMQYTATIVTGTPVRPLLDFGNRLSTYTYRLLRYSMLNENRQPFPFSELPSKNECEPQPSSIDFS